jgi:hypothetical protein
MPRNIDISNIYITRDSSVIYFMLICQIFEDTTDLTYIEFEDTTDVTNIVENTDVCCVANSSSSY